MFRLALSFIAMLAMSGRVVSFGSCNGGTECEPCDCDSNSDCADGLECSETWKPLLALYGKDERQAYCGSALPGDFPSNYEVCVDPFVLLCNYCKNKPHRQLREGRRLAGHKEGLGECALADCDTDDDCADGLFCSDGYKRLFVPVVGEARARTLYCDVGPDFPSNWEVCFDPCKMSVLAACAP